MARIIYNSRIKEWELILNDIILDRDMDPITLALRWKYKVCVW